jgi:hypothetical protein
MQGGEFVRTPKYAIGVDRKDSFLSRKYRVSLKRLLPFFELLLGLGFGWVIWQSFQHGMYGAIPFQMLFFFGFTYVAFLSLFQGRLTSR